MSALIAVEFRRLLSRRLFRVLVGLAVLGIAIGGVVVAVRSHAPPPGERARVDAQVRDCLDGKMVRAEDLPPGITLREFCEHNLLPSLLALNDPRYRLDGLPGTLKGLSTLLVIGGLLIGASFAGAEWQAGSMATLLTWEPRRMRVFLAKALACGVVVFVLAVALEALLGAVLSLVAATRGTTAGTGDGWLRGVVGLGARIGGLAGLAALMGLAITTVARNTAAAVGVAFAYFGVIEGLIRGLLPSWSRWLVGDNAVVFVAGRSSGPGGIGRSPTEAILLLFAYGLALMTAAALSFRARDVT